MQIQTKNKMIPAGRRSLLDRWWTHSAVRSDSRLPDVGPLEINTGLKSFGALLLSILMQAVCMGDLWLHTRPAFKLSKALPLINFSFGRRGRCRNVVVVGGGIKGSFLLIILLLE